VVVVTVTVTGAAGASEVGAATAVEGVAAVTVTVGADAAGAVCPAEQPASRPTASRGSVISFMSNSYSGPGGQVSQACGGSLGDFLEWLGVRSGKAYVLVARENERVRGRSEKGRDPGAVHAKAEGETGGTPGFLLNKLRMYFSEDP
jgi:hypothetical protein